MRRFVTRGRFAGLAPVAGLILGAVPHAAVAAGPPGGEVTLASHTPARLTATANGPSAFPSISADGAYVAFSSTATDLVPGQIDTNNQPDVFLLERATGAITLVSHVPASPRTTASVGGGYPQLSADGAYLVFFSGSGDLVAGQSGAQGNLFLFERATGAVTLVSHRPGSPADAAGGVYPIPSATPDASYVAFISTATDLVAGQTDGNDGDDVFLFARGTGEVALVSHVPDSASTTAGHSGVGLAVSADGAYVAFGSGATNLVDRQRDSEFFTNDVFLFERATGAVTLVSHVPGRAAATADRDSWSPSISANGAYVAFESFATNLVGNKGDANESFDVFLLERATGAVSLVSRTPQRAATAGDGGSRGPAISADGGFVTFTSFASNLVVGQTDADYDDDVFMFERATGKVRLVSHTPDSATTAADAGGEYHQGSNYPSTSADAAFVTFMSTAVNLVPGQEDGPYLYTDIFLFERATGTVSLVSHVPHRPTTTANDSSGLRLGGRGPENETPRVSAGGSAAFISLATNLVAGQTDANQNTDVFVFDR